MVNVTTIGKTVLFILTQYTAHYPRVSPNGYWFPELWWPYSYADGPYNTILATPNGGNAPIDPLSLELHKGQPIVVRYLNNQTAIQRTNNTVKISDVVPYADQIDAVFFPGSFSPLWDLTDDPNTHKIVRTVWENGGIVGAVCHGHAGFLNVKLGNGDYFVKGKKLTSWSKQADILIDVDGALPYTVETELVKRGAIYSADSSPYTDFTVFDGNLITAMGPYAAPKLGQELVRLLQSGSGSKQPKRPINLDDKTKTNVYQNSQ